MALNPDFERVLSFDDARAAVAQHAPGRSFARRIERAPLLSATGRVLAEAIWSDRDLPPFDRATRDGYAVRAADLAVLPVALRYAGQVRAGEHFPGELQAAEAAEIMTGAPVPAGADAVVMVEYTERAGDTVSVGRAAVAGENVVARGSEGKQGAVLLPAATRVGFAEISVLASLGRDTVPVFAPPRVAILATGDELVAINQQPGPYQIRNSNAYSLAAQVAAAGAEPAILPIAPDEPERLRALIEQGLAHDLLLLSGGVSMGKYDLVEGVLRALGAEFIFTGAKIQPGKPIVFGRVREKYFFGLPGNPVSTMVTFELFAKPFLEALGGMAPQAPRTSSALLASDVRARTGLTRFLPASLLPGASLHVPARVQPTPWQGSGDAVAVARANCWLIVPPDRELVAAGELVSVLLR